MELLILTFNPFQVNTYIIFNSKNQAVIIDPSCSNPHEQEYLTREIERLKLKPEMILLTHGHIDHILGCGFTSNYYNIDVYAHQQTEYFISQAEESATLFGIELSHAPFITKHLGHDDETGIEDLRFRVLHTPGHAPGSLCFHSVEHGILFSGDVLFLQSIGRTDLPMGDYHTLIQSISEHLLVLPPQTVVYPGHGPSTTIENEIRNNPFLVK
jgi:glyoxylase-like metal-dependent hydrolase (beta-lactamase superfamily II)